jgi:hypothetical protein
VTRLSRREVTVKTIGTIGLLFGAVVVAYIVTHFYGYLPGSKYVMTAGIMFGGVVCYMGYISICFRERETGLYVYETDI